MENKIKNQFDEISEIYDSQRKKIIPCFNDFYTIAAHFATSHKDNPKILDLGAGTGLLSSFVLKKYPDAQLTLLDISDNMLEVAKKRFSGLRNINYIAMDYSESKITEQYDLIISALSIHHLEDNNKIRLYNNMYTILNPQGIFVNADQCLSESNEYNDKFNKYWYNHIQGFDFTPDDIEGFKQRKQLDKESKLTEQITWLKDIGFTIVECVYKYMQFCVVVAEK